MPASNATFGKGTLLQVDPSGTGSGWVTISECKTISGPTFEAEEVDVTSHSSDGDFREYIRGLIDPGEITVEINYDPDHSTHQNLFTWLASGDIQDWRIRWASMAPGTTYEMTFTAFVRSMPISSPVDNVLTANITLRVTSQPAIASYT